MVIKVILKKYLRYILSPIISLILYYSFLYSGLSFLLFDKISMTCFYLIKDRAMPFSVFNDIWVSYLLTALLFIIILILSLLMIKSKKIKKSLIISIIVMVMIFTIYFYHLNNWGNY
jgi:hypothetical protein